MIIDDDRKYHEIMYKNGFIYDSKFNCFVKKGYGQFLTNTDDFSEHENYDSKMVKDAFFKDYILRGFFLIVGPPAPATNGEFYSKSAVYIKNYQDAILVGTTLIAKRKIESDNSINNQKSSKDSKHFPNTEIKPNLLNKTSNYNIITDDEISLIVNNFQLLIDRYKMATMHSAFGINVIDIAIDHLYSYEKEILNKYKNENLYKILFSLKNDLIEYDTCKAHIIYTLENCLLDNRFNQKVSSPKVDKFVAQGLRIINNYSTVQKPSMLRINVNDANNVAIDEIYDFIEMVNKLSLDERCTILYGINKYFVDKGSQLPDSAVKIINEIRNKLFEENFEYNQKDKSKIKK